MQWHIIGCVVNIIWWCLNIPVSLHSTILLIFSMPAHPAPFVRPVCATVRSVAHLTEIRQLPFVLEGSASSRCNHAMPASFSKAPASYPKLWEIRKWQTRWWFTWFESYRSFWKHRLPADWRCSVQVFGINPKLLPRALAVCLFATLLWLHGVTNAKSKHTGTVCSVPLCTQNASTTQTHRRQGKRRRQ